MCLLSFLKWGSIGYSLGIVQWDFTRREHPGNPGRVSGSGPVILLYFVLWIETCLFLLIKHVLINSATHFIK